MAKMKGVSPIIATIALVLIVIGMISITYSYMSGFLIGETGKSFDIVRDGAFCENGMIKVFVRSTSYETILKTSDFDTITVDGKIVVNTELPFNITPGLNLIPGDWGLLLSYNCTKNCQKVSDYHSIVIGTGSVIKKAIVQCE